MKVLLNKEHKRVLSDATELMFLSMSKKWEEVLDKIKKPNIEGSVISSELPNLIRKELEVYISNKDITKIIYDYNLILKKIDNNDSLNDSELGKISSLTDAYSRLGMGQVSDWFLLLNTISYNFFKDVQIISWGMVDHSSSYLLMKKEFFRLNPNAYYGIHSHDISDDFRISFDMHQVIRYHLSWKRNPEGGMGVNFRNPLKSSLNELLEIREDS